MGDVFDLASQTDKLRGWRQATAEPDFWSHPAQAGELLQQIEATEQVLNNYYQTLKRLDDLVELVNKEDGPEINQLVQEELPELTKIIDQLEISRFFTQPHDERPAILSIHAGTGGVEAQDWAAMLERMYLRYAWRNNWTSQVIEEQRGNEAGIKSVTLRLAGEWAYGYLRGENGTHRLLRNSPFNAQHLRQTSFAMVEVCPELPEAEAPVIDINDIKIDVFHASGPGGQGVNTTDSAVRITHLPTGLVVTCQSERSQHQNRALALAVLRSKLARQEAEELEKKRQALKGGQVKADWGLQIRSYFLYGQQLIKDHRTNMTTTDVEAVLDGKLDNFIRAYLLWELERRNKES